ncbi:MAG: hypothetical protein HY906_02920 [Deltaproteobacteria bacterium]|nr:hypothetical protein [Deltaproteobacteria bacterium]
MSRRDASSPGGRAVLQGKTLVGGPRSRAHFAALLGLDRVAPLGQTRVVAVAWVGDHVEIEVAGVDDQSVVFFLDRFQADKPRLFATEHLVLYYRGVGMWPELEERLRAVELGRLGERTIEDLAELIAADTDVDPAHDRPPRVSAEGQDAFDRQSHLSTWASPHVWYQFFGVAEIWRQRLDSLDIFERCTFIQHCDRECVQVAPRTYVPMVDGVFYPWLERVRRIGRARRRPSPAVGSAATRPRGTGEPFVDDPKHSMCTTDITEADVILGSQEKLVRVLDDVLERGVDRTLFLSCTCVPFVTGEDVESIVKRYRAKTDRPFFYLTTTPQSSVGVFRDVLVHRRRAAEQAVPPGEVTPHAVNLVGFARDPGLEELRGLLAQLGVSVNAVFVPEMDSAVVDTLPRASLHVLYPNVLWQSIYDQLLFDSRITAVSPAAPYGVAGTQRWLENVAAAVGLTVTAGDVVARGLEPLRGVWDRLRAEAAGTRLAFVVGADEAYRLGDATTTWGVPLIPMLEEMGFGLEVLIGVADRTAARDVATQINAVFAHPERHGIRAFRDRARLDSLLESGTFAAVYSDHLFDRRLTAAGKAQFSLQEFEKGVGGAVRTLRRLLEVCRLPLYRRYRRHLPAAAQPYAAPITRGTRRGGREGLAGPGGPDKLTGPGALVDGRR